MIVRNIGCGLLVLALGLTACAPDDDDNNEVAPNQLADLPDSMARAVVIPNFPQVSETPTQAQSDAAHAALQPIDLNDNQWRRLAGDGNHIGNGNTTTYVMLSPHKDANRDALTHGKLIGRFYAYADVNRLGIKQGYNYWVVGGAPGAWYTVVVPASGMIKRLPMQFTAHPGEDHEGPKARWVVYSDESGALRANADQAWGTCDPNGCCCSGDRSCEEPLMTFE